MLQANPSAAQPVWIERRRSMRFPTNDEAEVEVVADPPYTLSGFVRDASREGLRLALPKPLARGVQVKITLRGSPTLIGEVRYCRFAGTTYYAGIELASPEANENKSGARLEQ